MSQYEQLLQKSGAGRTRRYKISLRPWHLPSSGPGGGGGVGWLSWSHAKARTVYRRDKTRDDTSRCVHERGWGVAAPPRNDWSILLPSGPTPRGVYVRMIAAVVGLTPGSVRQGSHPSRSRGTRLPAGCACRVGEKPRRKGWRPAGGRRRGWPGQGQAGRPALPTFSRASFDLAGNLVLIPSAPFLLPCSVQSPILSRFPVRFRRATRPMIIIVRQGVAESWHPYCSPLHATRSPRSRLVSSNLISRAVPLQLVAITAVVMATNH
jgi:hypothetical protein